MPGRYFTDSFCSRWNSAAYVPASCGQRRNRLKFSAFCWAPARVKFIEPNPTVSWSMTTNLWCMTG